VPATRLVVLTKWFPPGDALAAKIARLCILREDFLLEMTGIYTEEIKELESHSQHWRQVYFFRNLIRTLRDMEAGLQRLVSDPEFKTLLAGRTTKVQEEFTNHAKAMAEGIGILKEIRNDVCGHVLEGAVQETLDQLAGSEVFGFLEIGSTQRETHLKFAGELVIQILVKGVPEADKQNAFMQKAKKIGALLPAFALVERALDIYMESRGLLRRQQR
jgi:hypothetical protein